jgi:ferredoxin
MGIKAHDCYIAAICFTCHAEIDQGKTYTKDVRKAVWDKAHKRTIGELFKRNKLKVLL